MPAARAGYAVAPRRRARAPTGRASPAATSSPVVALKDPGRKCARRPLGVRSARTLMVAAAARRQGSHIPLWLPFAVRGGLFPLTPRMTAAAPESVLRSERAARGRTYQRSYTHNAMPNCNECQHRGDRHDWTSPPCSAPHCFCLREHPRRLRGRCTVPGCRCLRYRPMRNWPIRGRPRR